MRFLIIEIILITLLFGCIRKEVEVIDLKEVFSDLKEGRTTIHKLKFDLSDCLYLDSSLKLSIDTLDSTYFKDRKIKFSKYLNFKDKEEISLNSNYSSVKDLVVSPDRNLIRYLRDQFGLGDYEKDILEPVLIYRERALLKFSNEFSSSGYVIELVEPNKIRLMIAYVIID